MAKWKEEVERDKARALAIREEAQKKVVPWTPIWLMRPCQAMPEGTAGFVEGVPYSRWHTDKPGPEFPYDEAQRYLPESEIRERLLSDGMFGLALKALAEFGRKFEIEVLDGEGHPLVTDTIETVLKTAAAAFSLSEEELNG